MSERLSDETVEMWAGLDPERHSAVIVAACRELKELRATRHRAAYLCDDHAGHAGHECRGCLWVVIDGLREEEAWQKERALRAESALAALRGKSVER